MIRFCKSLHANDTEFFENGRFWNIELKPEVSVFENAPKQLFDAYIIIHHFSKFRSFTIFGAIFIRILLTVPNLNH